MKIVLNRRWILDPDVSNGVFIREKAYFCWLCKQWATVAGLIANPLLGIPHLDPRCAGKHLERGMFIPAAEMSRTRLEIRKA